MKNSEINALCATDVSGKMHSKIANNLEEMGEMLGVSRQAVSKAMLSRSLIKKTWSVKKVSRMFVVKDMAGVYRVCTRNKEGFYVDVNAGWANKDVRRAMDVTSNVC